MRKTMSKIGSLFVVLVLVLSQCTYHLWPHVPEGVEDAEELRLSIFLLNVRNSMFRLQHRLGVENIFRGPREFFIHLRRLLTPSPVKNDNIQIQETTMNGVPVLLFTPKKRRNSAVVIYFHGGGYVMGSASGSSALCSAMAERLGSLVISVEYRLAPEFREPAALEDCVAVVKYVKERGKQQLQVDPDKIGLAGDSAGGYYATAVLVKLGPNLKPPVKALGLIVPALQQLSFNTPSHLENRGSPDIPRDAFLMYTLAKMAVPSSLSYVHALFVNNHTTFEIRHKYALKFDLPMLALKGPKELDAGGDPKVIEKFRHAYEDPLLSPLFADLSRFPATVILSCEKDVMRDDSVMMAQRLRKSNRTVEEVRLQSLHIGFAIPSYKPGLKAINIWMEKFSQHLLT